MTNLILNKGFLSIGSNGSRFNIFLNEEYQNLPPIEEVYNHLMETDLTKEEILKRLIDIYIPNKFIKGGHLNLRTTVTGLIGARGSGKSCNGSMITIFDYLIRGKKVWSNMEIEVTIKYRDCQKTFRSEDIEKMAVLNLDRQYQGGMVFLDEVNIEFAEARRTMSRRNLAFTNMLQQLRHRSLDLVYTTQNEGWVDDRLRFQTDIFLLCKDAALTPSGREFGAKVGEYSFIDAFDFSGVYTGRSFESGDKPISSITVWMKPFWSTYSTWKMQGMDEGRPEVSMNIGESQALRQVKNDYQTRQQELGVLADKLVKLCEIKGTNVIPSEELFEHLGISKLSERKKAGWAFRDLTEENILPISTVGNGRYRKYLVGVTDDKR